MLCYSFLSEILSSFAKIQNLLKYANESHKNRDMWLGGDKGDRGQPKMDTPHHMTIIIDIVISYLYLYVFIITCI